MSEKEKDIKVFSPTIEVYNQTAMEKPKMTLNKDVTQFLDELNHPLRKEIEQLRMAILNAHPALTENIKWSGPNYCFDNKDRITMKIQPPKTVQLIFHCGAKVQTRPKERVIKDDSGFLLWKDNDRAIATFKNLAEVEKARPYLKKIVKEWIESTI